LFQFEIEIEIGDLL